MNIFVLGPDLQSLGVVDQFESFIWTERYNQWGDFELYTLPTPFLMDVLQQDRYLYINKSDRLMIIEEIQITTDVEIGQRLIVKGRSLESLLERRIVWDKTILDGSLNDGILKLVEDAIMAPRDETRRIQNFALVTQPDEYLDSLSLHAQFAGENLYEVIQAICAAYEVGFKIAYDGSTSFMFSLYVGKDRTYTQQANPYVIFSPDFENLLDSNYLESKINLRTVALVAGEGEVWESKVKVTAETAGGSGTGLTRREVYLDGSSMTRQVEDVELTEDEYKQQLLEAGVAKLSEYTIVKAFEGSIDYQRSFVYGEDFFMGDVVQIVNDFGKQARSRVVEVVLNVSTDEIKYYPTFAAVPSTPIDAGMIPIVAMALGSGWSGGG